MTDQLNAAHPVVLKDGTMQYPFRDYLNNRAREFDEHINPVLNPNPHAQYVQWGGLWLDGTYEKNAVVRDGPWTMVALNQTTDRAAPQPSEPPTSILPITPTWTTQSLAARIVTGVEVELTSGGWFTSIDVWIPTVTATTQVRVAFVDVTDPANEILIFLITLDNPTAGQWFPISVQGAPIASGTKRQLLLEIIDAAVTTTWTHPWRFNKNETAAPAPENWNRAGNHSTLRIHKTAQNGDQSADLALIVSGTILRMTQLDDVSRYWEYEVNGKTDQGAYYIFTVNLLFEGAGGKIKDGKNTSIMATIPTPASADYVEELAFWPANQPSWGTVKGIESLDGVITPGVDDTAYGVKATFQPAAISPDWQMWAYSDIGG